MITHMVLLRPRSDLEPAARDALLRDLDVALREIPSIRRARVGRRVTHGRPYEALMTVDYQYAAVLEFDDLDGLKAYLSHSAHEKLANSFFAACESALMYDFDLEEGTTGVTGSSWRTQPRPPLGQQAGE